MICIGTYVVQIMGGNLRLSKSILISYTLGGQYISEICSNLNDLTPNKATFI